MFIVCSGLPGVLGAATLDTHVVVLDGEGKVIPWTASPAEGYDRVMFLSWDLLKNWIPLDPANGLPVTYTHSEYNPVNGSGSGWPNNPAGKNAMLADSAVMYYAYSGDDAVINLVRGLLDHHLQHGTTPAGYVWAKVPWSTAAAGSITYGNDSTVEGVGVLEPDKVGELGYHGYLKFYQVTGDTNYLNAAVACADALALHVRNGNEMQSPWPFRVVAQSGVVRDDYCAHVVAPIRLFDELIRLGLGDISAYQSARQKAWNWLMSYPMSNRVWVNYFEDVGGSTGNLNQYSPGQTARYLLEHPELDANWFNHVTNLLGFIESRFGGTDNGEAGLQFGARVISEQDAYKYKMASHTSRFGAVNALLYEATGDPLIKEKAYRSLNWCTYMCRNNGVVIEGPAEFANNSACWFTDGHGDYIRHFMLAIGAVPEWAPAGQNHIVRSTTVIKSVVYAPSGHSLAYTTFDIASIETLRIAFTPTHVLVNGVSLSQLSDLGQPGWVFNASNGILRVRHGTGTNVQIAAGPKAQSQSLTNAEDTVLAVTLTGSGVDGPATNFTVVEAPLHGSLGGVAPKLTYVPDTNYFGADSFRFVIDDGSLTSAVATVSIILTNINDTPRMPVQANRTISMLTTLVVTNTASDPDFPLDSLDYLLTGPTNALIDDDGVIIWTPTLGQRSSINEFRTVVTDDRGLSATNSFTVTVRAPNYFVQITFLDTSGEEVVFTWESIAGWSYLVQYKSNLTDEIWHDLPPTLTATGPTITVTNSIGDSRQRFYRVVRSFVIPITSFDAADEEVVFTWESIAGWSYLVQYKSNLTDEIWHDLPPILTATGPTVTVTNSIGDSRQRFYRVVESPP